MSPRRRNGHHTEPASVDSNAPMAPAISEREGTKVMQRTAVLRMRKWSADGREMRLEQLWLANDGTGEWRAVPVEIEA